MTLFTHADGHAWDDCVVCDCYVKASPSEILSAVLELEGVEEFEVTMVEIAQGRGDRPHRVQTPIMVPPGRYAVIRIPETGEAE